MRGQSLRSVVVFIHAIVIVIHVLFLIEWGREVCDSGCRGIFVQGACPWCLLHDACIGRFELVSHFCWSLDALQLVVDR